MPKMRAAIRHPNIHFWIRVCVAAPQPHDARFVVEALEYTVDDSAELQRHHIDIHSELAEVVLNNRRHFRALRIRGTGDDGELYRLALPIHQLAVAAPREARRFQ